MHTGLKITGGRRLEGTVKLWGAKNAVAKLLVASLLSDQRCTLYNVPNILEVASTVELCREIGSRIEWDQEAGVLAMQTPFLRTSYIPQTFSGANRIPILMLGALLGRSQDDLIVPTVGGCHLGKRPVDFHIKALEALGAQIEYREMRREGAYFARAHRGLKGAMIELPYPSVGATENAILAGVRAQGTTILKNAALEPEVVDLILFLQKMGAHIRIGRDRTIYMEHTQTFRAVSHEVVPDRNVAVSFALATLATRGRLWIQGARHEDLINFFALIHKLGASIDFQRRGILITAEAPLKGNVHIETDVHPGFMTDWQQPLVVLLTQVDGSSVIHETVYENRLGFTETLQAMGAHIGLFKECLGNACRFQQGDHIHSAVIRGPTPLQAGKIEIPDLRAGFAYVMAGLVAEGKSEVWGLHYLERGYPNIVGTLQELGAHVEKIEQTLPSTQPMKPVFN